MQPKQAGWAFLAALVWGLFFNIAPALAATSTSLVTVNTRPGVTQKFLLIKPDQPVASVILFAGGDGLVNLSQNADGSVNIGGLTGNFLVRMRQNYVDHGFMVAVVDTPSSHPGGMGLFRGSAEHAEDIAAVVAYMRQQVSLPVWLIGTSAGSQSAANLAIRLTQGIGGAVLTSSVTGASSTTVGVLTMNLESIRVPVLSMSHADDQCTSTPPADSQRIVDRLTSAPAKVSTLLTGGSPPVTGPCEGRSQHGFFGIETQAVDAIAAFIRSNSPHAISGTASGQLTSRVLDVALQPALADLGKTRQIFVAGILGSQLYFLTSTGWQAWIQGGYPPYASRVLSEGQAIRVFDGGFDLSGVAGAQIFVGYGADSTDMLANGRYAMVHTVQ